MTREVSLNYLKKKGQFNLINLNASGLVFLLCIIHTVKLALRGHSKIDKTKVLKTNGSLMKIKSIAECSLGAFCNTFDLYKAMTSLEKQFLVFLLSGRLRQVLL